MIVSVPRQKSEKSKIDDLKKLNNKLSEFIETAARKDSAAEEEIKKSKEDFYTKYSYLKPECEKSVIEHICDGVQSAADWCKEHWKLIVTIAIVIVSVAVLLIPGVGPIIAGACWGAILGACIGGVSGGLESIANGGSFLEGFEDGALSGAISGAIGGAAFAGLGQLGAFAGKGIKCMSGFGKFIKGTASVTKVMSTAMGGFDTIALVDKAFGNGDIATLNAKLHESKAYNIFQTGVAATAVFTGGMTTTMKCFVAGTLVLTASGLVAIENIKPGDMVYAADAETLEVSTKQVLETYIRETSSLVHLTINGENIISTYDHPYYVKDKGFVSAEALWIGAELIDKNGNVVLVEQLYRENLGAESVKVYNFQVDDYHTYFVSEYCILVHNAGDLYSRPSGYRKGVRDKTWNEAKASSPDGVVRDPKTGRPIDFNEPWDMGHKPGYEFRKHKISAKQRGISRKQFLDEHNDYTHYRPELPSSNRSHTCEDLTDFYLGD